MKSLFIFSVVYGVLFSAVPVYSMEVSADKIRTIQEYSGNAIIEFKLGEKFNITSNRTSTNNGITIFSGNVVVMSKGTTLKTDSVTFKKLADGAVRLEAKKFSLEHAEEGMPPR